MAVLAEDIDGRSLRRIALLVMRAKQDCGRTDCPDLQDISSLIESMKRAIAIGSAFSGDDLRAMRRLIQRLDHGPSECTVRLGIVEELRDLIGVRH